MSGSIGFYGGIFLHVISVRIMVPSWWPVKGPREFVFQWGREELAVGVIFSFLFITD